MLALHAVSPYTIFMTNPELYRDSMRLALEIASHSDDPSTQTSAVIVNELGNVLTSGVNNMPDGVSATQERLERPLKYQVREHAERAAIYQAARFGHATIDAAMVSLWAACADCSRAVIGSGIKKFVCYPWNHGDSHWDEDIAIGRQMMHEAGVEVIDHDFPGLDIPPIRRNYELWTPGKS